MSRRVVSFLLRRKTSRRALRRGPEGILGDHLPVIGGGGIQILQDETGVSLRRRWSSTAAPAPAAGGERQKYGNTEDQYQGNFATPAHPSPKSQQQNPSPHSGRKDQATRRRSGHWKGRVLAEGRRGGKAHRFSYRIVIDIGGRIPAEGHRNRQAGGPVRRGR